jgi:hypothetical protein
MSSTAAPRTLRVSSITTPRSAASETTTRTIAGGMFLHTTLTCAARAGAGEGQLRVSRPSARGPGG